MTRPEPDFDAFAAAYEAGTAQVVRMRLVSDLETPVGAFLKVAGDQANAFLFESVEGGAARGRYSILGMRPDLIWRCRGEKAEVNRRAAVDSEAFEACPEPPLTALAQLVEESRIALPQDVPPMAAGLFGYLGYDMVRLMERLPAPGPDPLGLPDALLIRPTIVMIFDHVRDEIAAATPVRPQTGVSAKIAYGRAVDRLSEALDALDHPVPKELAANFDVVAPVPVSNTSPDEYKTMVLKAKEYVAAGDVFQVVLSQRFEAPFSLPAFALYRALRRINPSPFLVYFNFGGFQIACSSPEVLVRLRDGRVTIRPLAGTRPRGANPEEDRKLEDDLLADPKERAEHLMLLDLGRNDVGRVAEIGSVTVTGQFFVERYSHVMHIVSNVEGRLRADLSALEALAAGFPAGTVSGAPKIRAMEIIAELEKEKRGVYAGCLGYFGADGAMDTCIALRTAVVKDGRMVVQAGAGIVADSSPEAELKECVDKARALFRAAEEAGRFAAAAGRGQ